MGYHSGNGDNIQVNLSKTYNTIDYIAMITKSCNTAGGGDYGVGIISKTKSSFNTGVSSQGIVSGFYWKTEGFIS